jgi:class 3 adenylate cyclase
MEFRILGPLEVRENARELPLGGAKQRALLALLLLRANELVATEQIVEELWGERPPPTATKTVQVYVSQLRKALGRELVDTRGPGYVLRIPRGALDLYRFEDLLDEGRRLVGEGAAADARRALDEALGLWRGSALVEFQYEPFAQNAISRLDELRLAALELRLEARLELGLHAEAVPELEALVRDNPLRESLRRLLMLALYRGGRQAEALGAYQDARAALVEELGLEPSHALQELEKAILMQAESLELPRVATGAPRPAPAPAAPSEPAPGAQREARKTVTVIFCDVVASSELAERLDAESLRGLLARFFDEAAAVLAHHGGNVEKFVGDAVMAVFGVPVVREDDALRAACAAVDLRTRVAARLPELQLRVGVNTGEVVAGDASSGATFVTGDAVNVAKRLEEVAEPGQILLGAETYALVAHAVEGELLDAVQLKGKHERQVPFRLDQVDTEAPAFLRRADAPLVGRAAELAKLRELFAQVAGGGGTKLVTICGDAGIGKSRLVRELVAEIEGDATVLIGRCPPYGEGVTFLPLRELLGHAGREEAELGATSHEIFSSTRAIVEQLATDAPVVAVFEDVHWAEPTFLDLVEYLQGRLGASPVLLLCLTRPELAQTRPGWLQEPAVAIALHPLSPEESELLLDGLGTPADVRRRIAEAAEGNPLFVEQLAALAEDDAPLPASIRGVLAERLDRLSRDERAVIERAAVAGRSFTVEQVIELCTSELREQVHARLPGLVRLRLLRPDTELPDGFRFQHALIRDAAYEGIPKAVRADLHEQMAELVEDDAIGGYHLEQAHRYREQLGANTYGLAARAGQLLARGGHDAFKRSDLPAAISLFERAAELLPEEDPVRPSLLAELGSAQIMANEWTRAGETLAAAERAAQRAGDRKAEMRVALEQQFLRSFTAPAEAAADNVRVAEALMPELERLGDDLGLAKAWWLKSEGDGFACRWQARTEALERGLAHARRAADAREEPNALAAHLAIALYYGPTPVAVAIDRCEELLTDAGGNRALGAALKTSLAGLRAMNGEFDVARQLYAEAVGVHDELRMRFRRYAFSAVGASIEALAGDMAAAECELRLACDALAAAGERGVRSALQALLAQLLAGQHRDGEAEALARETAADAGELDIAPQVVWRAVLGQVLARRGEQDEAEALAREADERAALTDFPELRAAALLARAEVSAEVDPFAAMGFVEAARVLYDAKGNVVAADALSRRAPFPPSHATH